VNLRLLSARVAACVAALFILVLATGPSLHAQTVPALTGRVVDQADLLTPAQESELTAKLEALERASSRQLVVVTVPDLQGFAIEDFGFRLGTEWKIGNEDADNGAILLIALAERKIRIEVGDGLEPILTDAMSGIIIRDTMRPRFQAGDVAGGINAGVDAIIQQLQAPPEEAERRALQAAGAEREQARSNDGGSIFPLIFWLIVLAVIHPPACRGLGAAVAAPPPARWADRPLGSRPRRLGRRSSSSSSSGWGGWSGSGGGGWTGGGGFSGGGTVWRWRWGW
jgi:uncharacterized protein